MRLTQPTDFEILEALATYGRNVSANIAVHIDRNRPYVNTRMPHLQDQGLVTKIGPTDNSGLYELTDRGQAALSARDQYGDVDPDQFEAIVESA